MFFVQSNKAVHANRFAIKFNEYNLWGHKANRLQIILCNEFLREAKNYKKFAIKF